MRIEVSNVEHVELLVADDVPSEVMASAFWYVDPEDTELDCHWTPRFGMRSNGEWFDTWEHDYAVTRRHVDLYGWPSEWEGAFFDADTLFSGLVWRFHEECPQDWDGHEYDGDSWSCVTVGLAFSVSDYQDAVEVRP